MCRHSLVYAANVNIMVVSRHTIKKNTEALIMANNDTGLEVTVTSTKYMDTSLRPDKGQNHNIKIGNKCSEMVGQFRYLGTNLTNQSAIHENISSRMKVGMLATIWFSILCLPVSNPNMKINIHKVV